MPEVAKPLSGFDLRLFGLWAEFVALPRSHPCPARPLAAVPRPHARGLVDPGEESGSRAAPQGLHSHLAKRGPAPTSAACPDPACPGGAVAPGLHGVHFGFPSGGLHSSDSPSGCGLRAGAVSPPATQPGTRFWSSLRQAESCRAGGRAFRGGQRQADERRGCPWRAGPRCPALSREGTPERQALRRVFLYQGRPLTVPGASSFSRG